MYKNLILVLTISFILIGSEFAEAKEIKVCVKGMVCAFCAQGITKKFKVEPAVRKIDVSLEKKTVVLELNEGKDISDEKIEKILKDSGYNVEKIERI